jgi:hypothetical protein
MRRDERDATAVVTDITATERADDGPRHAAERRDFPQRALLTMCVRRGVIDERARVGRPSRLRMIGRIARHLEWHAAAQELHPDLTMPVRDRDIGDHLSVG